MDINQDWQSFVAEDPFNNNLVEGRISHHHGDDYGALLIEKVNGEKVTQLIYCTPKLAYPFDKNGNWHWPKAKIIERYEKLDGTNIFAYRYKDSGGKEYLSYKTRLLPFVRNSRFGPFIDMWKDILGDRPMLAELPILLDMNLSFELWGARNPHLVKYETPLSASLLFARRGQVILPPRQIERKEIGWFQATYFGDVAQDYTEIYKGAQTRMQIGLKEIEDGYLGQEGEVWYLQDETGKWQMFKCKPETIEAIHWSAGGIGRNVIAATIENAFENWDEPTVEQVTTLLLEEYPPPEVEKVHYRIAKLLEAAKEQHRFKEQVLTSYLALNMNILESKAEVMRALAPQYKKDQMKKVFSIIWSEVVQ